ncbi:MAG TPA: hypothetical protein VFQ43_17765 [Nitrososphaera sp.]|nr:hypothetical protein [Nitrososphaera sp.]
MPTWIWRDPYRRRLPGFIVCLFERIAKGKHMIIDLWLPHTQAIDAESLSE